MCDRWKKISYKHPWRYMQFLKWKFEFTGLNQILEFIFIYFYIKIEKFTGPIKVLLVLGQRTGAHCEDCTCICKPGEWYSILGASCHDLTLEITTRCLIFFFQEIWAKRKVNLWCTLWYYKQHCLYNIS